MRQQADYLVGLVATRRSRRHGRRTRGHELRRHLVGCGRLGVRALCVRHVDGALDRAHLVGGRNDVAVALLLQRGGKAGRQPGDRIDGRHALLDQSGKDGAAGCLGFALAGVGDAGIGIGNARLELLTLDFTLGLLRLRKLLAPSVNVGLLGVEELGKLVHLPEAASRGADLVARACGARFVTNALRLCDVAAPPFNIGLLFGDQAIELKDVVLLLEASCLRNLVVRILEGRAVLSSGATLRLHCLRATAGGRFGLHALLDRLRLVQRGGRLSSLLLGEDLLLNRRAGRCCRVGGVLQGGVGLGGGGRRAAGRQFLHRRTIKSRALHLADERVGAGHRRRLTEAHCRLKHRILGARLAGCCQRAAVLACTFTERLEAHCAGCAQELLRPSRRVQQLLRGRRDRAAIWLGCPEGVGGRPVRHIDARVAQNGAIGHAESGRRAGDQLAAQVARHAIGKRDHACLGCAARQVGVTVLGEPLRHRGRVVGVDAGLG